MSNFSLEGGNWEYVYDISIFLKWGILNVPFCSIFVPFHFYLVMILVVPCLDNIFMFFLISELLHIGVTKPIFLDSGSPRGEGVCACVGMVCYHCIVHILNSNEKPYFLCLEQRFVQSYASKLLEDIFLCFVPK